MPGGSRAGPQRPGSPGPMECYYIVISSAHLSNGHFRNIKGVFRGPLSKNGDKTLDYAEKKNTIAKALEDLKANFYCELCDKQYYKHQEFDNHINSYDHAHKQRLKELKQREFARNVASKSRKDERKQEKALQRLHKLAELRKETACAPGSGPMFKSTTVTVQDNSNDIPQNAAIDSANKQDFSCTLINDVQNCKDATSVISSTPENVCSNKSDTNKFGDQVQGAQGQRVGFSFAFPKKAAVKLESSAAVFYEYNDETSTEHGFSRRSRFIPGVCSLQSPSAAEIVLCPEEKNSCFHPVVEKCTDTAEAPKTQDSKELASEESRELESPVLIPAVSHSKQLMSSDMDGCSTDGNTADVPSQTLSTVVDSTHNIPLGCSSCELLGNGTITQTVVEDCLTLQNIVEENGKDGNSEVTVETEIKNLEADPLVPSHSEDGSRAPQSKLDTRKRSCEPFVPVLSKHGTNVLQWPSEMLIYTSTDPSISYSCNPLYFDFKLSKVSDNQEKRKHQPSIPHLQLTTESNHSSVSDFTNKPTSECGDHETEVDKNVCDYTIPLISDVSHIRNCDLAKIQNKVSLGESFRIRKLEKYHISRNHLRQSTVIDEKYNKVRIKESHEKWLHRSRKRKRRRKLCHCHHHHPSGEATFVEMEISSVTEKEISHRDENKYLHLQNNPEKCRYDAGNIWLAMDEVQQSHQKAGLDNGHKRSTSTSDHIHGDRGSCDIWNAKTRDQRSGCRLLHRKRKASSRRQLKHLSQTSRRHNCMCSKMCCSWKVRRLVCSPEHKCLGPCSEAKSMSQNHSVKRSYNFLTDEPEKSHRKRRQHTYSCSSDESSYGQTFLEEGYVRQTSTSGMHHKEKCKHRRRKTRIKHVCIDRNTRSETSRPSKENSANSTLNVLGEFLTRDNMEETNVDPKADHAKVTDETMQLEENKSALQMYSSHLLEKDTLTDCVAPESTPGAPSEAVTHSAASAAECGAPASANTQDILEDEKKNENVNSHENQAHYKAPPATRPLEQAPPKSYVCHYELAESLPCEKINEVTNEWVQCNSGIFDSPPPLPFKEAHINSHTFLTTEQLIAPFTLPDQTLIFPPDNHEKFKDLPSEAYQQLMQQNMLANKVKFTFPPPAIQPPSSPLQPLPLQPPLCSTSVTTIHHTVLQQHAAAAAAASTFKVLQPHQQFLSQVPALSRAPLPHLPVGPRLCPGGHAAFVAPPHLPLVPPSVLHPTQLAFSPLPHAVFPSLLSPHPAVLPLQPLF
ncbi:zinc finger protein 804A [Cygnus atratus]|uniref:zinc finger protein 804A n=1 Tax=Cygnus atratus TaxID=8868 RepID=UPI0015D5B9CB|nr:zinc finger protein 804A [Cygnus atratus]